MKFDNIYRQVIYFFVHNNRFFFFFYKIWSENVLYIFESCIYVIIFL